MDIYLVRHAKPARGFNDFEKPLSPEGIKQFLKNLKIWQEIDPHIDFIVSSPLTRAIQTSELIRNYFEVPNEIVIEEELKSGSQTEFVITMANSLPGDNIVFVGHEPDMGYHVSNFISNSGANVEFETGTVAKIHFFGDSKMRSGKLEFLLKTPK